MLFTFCFSKVTLVRTVFWVAEWYIVISSLHFDALYRPFYRILTDGQWRQSNKKTQRSLIVVNSPLSKYIFSFEMKNVSP